MSTRFAMLALAPSLLALGCPVAAQAQPASDISDAAEISRLDQRATDVVAVMREEMPADEVFAPTFLKAVPSAQLAAVNAQMTAQFGAIIGIENVTPVGPNGARIMIRFEQAIATGNMQLESDKPHRIIGLLLNEFQPIDDNAEKLRADLTALPGTVSILFAPLDDDSEPILALNSDRQMAIGSTFKLYILSALARSIENGERDWADVVELDRRSFPSGRLQDWPEGSPITLHTLATLMISISDNTATDVLLHEVGREAVEAELVASGHADPTRTLPMLSTLQMFALKGSEGNLRKYQAADEARQRMILADFEDDVGGNPNLVTPPRFVEPTAIDTVEWFASGHDLQRLGRRLAAFADPTARDIMAVNSSLPKPTENEWGYAGFKGGSEPGVLNLTWLLQDEAGEWHILAMSWNNTEANVDSSTFELIAQRIIALAN